MSAMASQITSLTIVSTVYSRRRSKKTSKPRVTGNSLHKGPVTRKMFPFDDVIMFWVLSGQGSCGFAIPRWLFLIIRLKFPATSRVSIITLWIYKILYIFNNWSLASRKFCDRSSDNNLSAKTKWQKGVIQDAVLFGILTKICMMYKPCLLNV